MKSSWRATSADVKQLAWAVLLLSMFVGVLGLLTRDYFGPDTIAVTIGLAAFVTAIFALIVAASLLVSLAADLVHWARRSCSHLTKRLRGRAREQWMSSWFSAWRVPRNVSIIALVNRPLAVWLRVRR